MVETNCGGPSAPSNIAPMSEHLAEMRDLKARVEAQHERILTLECALNDEFGKRVEALEARMAKLGAVSIPVACHEPGAAQCATAKRLQAENEELKRKADSYSALNDEAVRDRDTYRRRSERAEAKIRELEARPAGVPVELVREYAASVSERHTCDETHAKKREEIARAALSPYLDAAPVGAPPATEYPCRPCSRPGHVAGVCSCECHGPKPSPEVPPSTLPVLEEVAAERIKQERKWGQQNHHPFTYLAVLGEEVGEANMAALQSVFGGKSWPEYRKELVQIAAVAVAMIECHDRNGPPGPILESERSRHGWSPASHEPPAGLFSQPGPYRAGGPKIPEPQAEPPSEEQWTNCVACVNVIALPATICPKCADRLKSAGWVRVDAPPREESERREPSFHECQTLAAKLQAGVFERTPLGRGTVQFVFKMNQGQIEDELRAFVARFAPPVAVTWESLSEAQRDSIARLVSTLMDRGYRFQIGNLARAFHLDEAAAREGRAVPKGGAK